MVVQIDFFMPNKMAPACYIDSSNALSRSKEIRENSTTPVHILKRLSASCDSDLRTAVADHVNTPLKVLLLLAEDENPDVRFAIAENHNISRDVLNKLTIDSNPYVAQRAEKTLSRVQMNDFPDSSWRSIQVPSASGT